MKTIEAKIMYIESQKLARTTILAYNNTFKLLSEKFPDMPEKAYPINSFLTSFTEVSDQTVRGHYKRIKAVLKFLTRQIDFPDYLTKLIPPKLKKKQRRYWSQAELENIFLTAQPGIEKTLVYLLFFTPCRIGEIGRNPYEDKPGLRINNISNNEMIVNGKTGERKYALRPAIKEMLLNLGESNKQGIIFYNPKTDSEYTTDGLKKLFRIIVKRAGITGLKLGPHTMRHTAASLIAKDTQSALTVMSVLQQDNIATSMIYIHDAQDQIKHEVKSLDKMSDKLFHKPEGNQMLMLTDGTPQTQTIEHCEGTIDLSEELFPNIPEQTEVRPLLKAKDLIAIRKAAVYYSRHAPIDGISGELSALFKRILRRTANV
jgi:integrase